MRPRTKLHREVLALQKNLWEPKEYEQFVIDKHDFYFTTHYKNLVCMECNHMWKPELELWKEKLTSIKCPSCNRKLKEIKQWNKLYQKVLLYQVASVVDRFQVIRYYSCWKTMSKNEPPRYNFRSLFEEWKDWDKEKSVIIGRTISYSGDGFSSSEYELRDNTRKIWGYRPPSYDNIYANILCPNPEFIPRFKKYGLDKYINHCCDLRKLMYMLEMSPKVETLFKLRERHLLYEAVHNEGRHTRYWPQIKITIRNKYKIKDPSIWYDYLDLLVCFRKDIHNPKFICPNNLMKEHDRWMKKKERVLEQQRIERERQEVIKRQQDLEQARKDYIKRFRKYFKLKFTSGDISIQALQSVDEFQDEGKELNHCIFTNEYYNKEDSLLLSVRVLGVRTETVEVCLKTFKILQSRGKNNNATDYNDVIRDIVERNMRKISKIANSSNKNKNKVKP
jgi:hypothetical protein